MVAEDKGLVSIVTPAFNAAPYLADTIESCLAQTHQHFELLIVDDGSTDATFSIAERFAQKDHRVRVFREPNRGISAARNIALGSANGAFIALLDSDDVWMPDYLEQQVHTLLINPEVDVVTTNAINMGGQLDGTPYWPPSTEPRHLPLREIILREDAVSIFSVFRRSVLDRVGVFDPAFRGNEDYHFWLRAAAAGCRFVADCTPRAYYRRRPDSMSANEQRMLRGIADVLKDVRPLCAVDSPETAAIDTQLAQFSRRLHLSEARDCLVAGDCQKAVELLKMIPAKDRGWGLSALLHVVGVWPSVLSVQAIVRNAPYARSALARHPRLPRRPRDRSSTPVAAFDLKWKTRSSACRRAHLCAAVTQLDRHPRRTGHLIQKRPHACS